jgi:hypothetical protein
MDITRPEIDLAKTTLQSWLDLFTQYSDEIFGDHQQPKLDKLRNQLQRLEPMVTQYMLQICGNGVINTGSFGIRQQIPFSALFATAVGGGNNESRLNFYNYKAAVISVLNNALGRIEAGLWPKKNMNPTLIIRDDALAQRYLDLLRAQGNYDRVIREATTILEDRIRTKVPHETLAKIIPNSADQTGDNLINRLFSPDKPIITISDNKNERISFFRILLGVNSFLRNPYHHTIDNTIEWSWAWSVVGFIDQLLYFIDGCTGS